jgi:hypothetical protein
MTPFMPICHYCQGILRLPEEDGHRVHIVYPTELFDHVEVLTTVWAPYYTIHKVYKMFQSTLCFSLTNISIVVLSCDLNLCLEFISLHLIPLSMRFSNCICRARRSFLCASAYLLDYFNNTRCRCFWK